MRYASLCVLVLAACSRGPRAPWIPPDAPPADAEPDAAWIDPRQASGVVVGPHRVLWTQHDEDCTIPLRCVDLVAPTLSMRDLATDTLSTLVEDTTGADFLVGDEDEVFMVLHDQSDGREYVARFRPGISTAPEPMSMPVDDGVILLFVDPTYVYWRVSTSVYRASRTGDGSDATVVLTGNFDPIATFDGYYWSDRYRVPIHGGPMEEVTSVDRVYPIAIADHIYAAKMVDPFTYSLGLLGTDDVYQPVIASVPKEYLPERLVVDGSDLFWQHYSSMLYRARPGGPVITTDLWLGHLFTVTADAIVYNFNRNGYDEVPR